MLEAIRPPDAPPPLFLGLAGWRCRLTTDTWAGHQKLTKYYGSSTVEDRGEDVSTFHVLFEDGPLMRLRLTHGEKPGDFSPLFSGPEGKRFVPVTHPERLLYADMTTGSPDPTLELQQGELCLLGRERWQVYVGHALTWLMLRESPLAALHAAVCAVDGVALLMIGPSGCGKSTLSWALAQQGADYFSDECAFLDRKDYRLYTEPQRVSLRPGGVEALKTPPDISRWYESKPNDLKCTPAMPAPKAPCPQEQALLLFVEGFGKKPALTPIGGGAAARRLVSVMGYGTPSPLARLEAAADIVSRFPCLSLTIGRPEETASLLIAYARENGCPTQ